MTYDELLEHLADAHDDADDSYTAYGAVSAHVAHHAPDLWDHRDGDLLAVLGPDHEPLPPQHVAP